MSKFYTCTLFGSIKGKLRQEENTGWGLVNSKLTFKPRGLSAGPSPLHRFSLQLGSPLRFQANPRQLLKEKEKMLLLAKRPALRAQEGSAHPIKVTKQGSREERRGQRHRGISGEVEGRSWLQAGRSEHQFVAPHPPRHARGQGNLPLRFGADGETEAGRGRDGSKVTQEAESPGRRGGGKERASLPSSLWTLQSQAAKGRSPGCTSRL